MAKTDISANLSLGYQFNNKLSALINAKASRYNIAPKSFGQNRIMMTETMGSI